MKRTFRQRPDGSLEEVTPRGPMVHAGTFQVGDLPDIKKDCERNKVERANADKRARKQTLIDVVNSYS